MAGTSPTQFFVCWQTVATAFVAIDNVQYIFRAHTTCFEAAVIQHFIEMVVKIRRISRDGYGMNSETNTMIRKTKSREAGKHRLGQK